MKSKPILKETSAYDYVLSMGDRLGEYVNEWIAVVDNKVIAKGSSAKEVYESAKRYDPKKIPFIMRVPKAQVMVL